MKCLATVGCFSSFEHELKMNTIFLLFRVIVCFNNRRKSAAGLFFKIRARNTMEN